jgi:FkbM family methyltransferase
MPVDRVFEVWIAPNTRFAYRGSHSDVVARALYWEGLRKWERETWREFIPLAQSARGFLDIGAFTGAYSLAACAANPHLRCLAFEPVPSVHGRLVANIDLNGWSDRATAVNVAVSDQCGHARFFLPHRRFPDTGHLETSLRHADLERGSWVTVPTATLASMVPDGFPVDLLKIDVEDAEGPVIRGLLSLLTEHRPAIIIELLPTGGFRELPDALDAFGYSYFHLTRRGRIAVERPVPVDGDASMNYLCLPPPGTSMHR